MTQTVLCFGDSNTYGQRSDDVRKGRWSVDVRWTGRLQALLGDDYDVIEEGLSGRTAGADSVNLPESQARLMSCLRRPVDVVVIMLGSNDLKVVFHRTARQVATLVDGLVDDIVEQGHGADGRRPRIIIVSPIQINSVAPQFSELYSGDFNGMSVAESKKLARELKKIAESRRAIFLDAASVSYPGADGLHFAKGSHEAFATLLRQNIVID